MSQRNTGSSLTERRREQNRIAQRKFRERHRTGEADRQANTQPPHKGRTRGDAASASPNLSGSTVTAADADTDLAIPQSTNLFSTDDTIHFGSLEDVSLPDMQCALGTAVLGLNETNVDYFEHDDFVVSPGHQPVELNGKSAESEHPLHMAVLQGSRKIVHLLLKHGANCNAKDGRGLTPLIHAIIKEQEDIVDMLLSHGAQIQLVDNHFQRSPVHWTVLKRQDRLLKVVMKHCQQNVDIINAYDIEGKTPLHIAINLGWDAAVEMLLDAGADVSAPTKPLGDGN